MSKDQSSTFQTESYPNVGIVHHVYVHLLRSDAGLRILGPEPQDLTDRVHFFVYSVFGVVDLLLVQQTTQRDMYCKGCKHNLWQGVHGTLAHAYRAFPARVTT